MPQLNLALMDAVLLSLFIFTSLNDYFNILEQTTDDITTFNIGVLIS